MTLSATLRRLRAGLELPTILVAALIYGGWIALTWWHAAIPAWLLFALGGWLVAWHGSLQHETIHGHPTPWAALNRWIGFVPLSLWLPYDLYRHSHLAHHATPEVTHPAQDPESRYLTRAGGWAGLAAAAQATLLGRLILGPVITIAAFLLAEARRAAVTPRLVAAEWGPHLAASGVLIAWLEWTGLGLGAYLLVFVYPGTALSLLRSFAEHRADPLAQRRAAIVEHAGPFGLLFLHNNLHVAHHAQPGLAWYRLPDFHRRHRAQWLEANGHLLYRGYGDVFRRFALRPHDAIVHPDCRQTPP